ncbi:MAG: PhoH family protein [Legionellales bacterium]|nr:PhoH family protein [Legionellales bacterium]
MKQKNHIQLVLEPFNNLRLNELCGQFDENIKQIEKELSVQISRRGNSFIIKGDHKKIVPAKNILEKMYEDTNNNSLSKDNIHLMIKENTHTNPQQNYFDGIISIKSSKKTIKSRSSNQQKYIDNIKDYDINFAIGPAGTGKTFLAVACAVTALELGEIKRLVFVRPAVEAGEKLGFLPGDLAEKVNPYLRPLYDSLYSILGIENVEKMMQHNIIEIAPLAFMRGRTLNDSFVILDEAQNTTIDQMKMFLTRMGFGSKVAITGDVTQVDLNMGIRSGLVHAKEILNNIDGIKFNFFNNTDIVRHKLVQEILEAYNDTK